VKEHDRNDGNGSQSVNVGAVSRAMFWLKSCRTSNARRRVIRRIRFASITRHAELTG
jgi:hypothetical protein